MSYKYIFLLNIIRLEFIYILYRNKLNLFIFYIEISNYNTIGNKTREISYFDIKYK